MKLLKNVLMLLGVCFVVSTLIFAVQDNTPVNVEKKTEPTPGDQWDDYRITTIDIPEGLNFAGEAVPAQDPEVRERVDREFLVNKYWQSNAILLMKRAHMYFPVIEPILAKNGIPDDFKYLAVAESGLLNVVSPAGATGFWQLMRATGKEYGLEINNNVDERYHVVKSTEAACQYLIKAKEKFGTWTLAAASYNAGSAGIQKYMDIQKANSYYDLLLGEETGRYVFRLLAIKEILSHPQKYGFDISPKDLYTEVPTYSVEVDTAVSNFADFAKQYGINYKILKRHNPWLREPNLNNVSGKKYVIEIPRNGYYMDSK
jgi:hypothetical protein